MAATSDSDSSTVWPELATWRPARKIWMRLVGAGAATEGADFFAGLGLAV